MKPNMFVGEWCKVIFWRSGAAVLAMLFVAFGAVSAHAQTAKNPETAKCEAIKKFDFSHVEDAPMQVLDASLVPAEAAAAYCRVEGYVVPHVGFEIRLPVANWNGKFLHYGCGAACGGLYTYKCDDPIRRGYACIVGDMGHRSRSWDGRWSYNNLQAEFDFGIRASHVTTLAGKAITGAYYARPIARSYFSGCSNGGLEAMTAAQRFPWDFDGIIAGAPGISETNYYMYMLWNVRHLLKKDGKPIVSAADLRFVHQSVVNACDMDDGLKDGIIGDPSRCAFRPSQLVCRPGRSSSCLSAEQAAAVQKVYDGPTTSDGKGIAPGGAPLGSELTWNNFISDDPDEVVSYSPERVADMFRYRAFVPDPGPSWNLDDFDFDHDYKRLGMMEALYLGTNPDLRKFKAAGGKLLVYQGWWDPLSLPAETIDYMETVERTMGGSAQTMDFARLFMVPGMDHCSGGAGAFAIDYLGYLDAWVDKGVAPDVLMGAHVEPDASGKVKLAFPLGADQKVTIHRPIFPYPLRAKYVGRGDPSDAKNWKAVAPK